MFEGYLQDLEMISKFKWVIKKVWENCYGHCRNAAIKLFNIHNVGINNLQPSIQTQNKLK